MNKHLSILSFQHQLESVTLRSVGALLCIALAGYLYLVGSSVLHVMARKEAHAGVEKLMTAIAEREQQYFALSGSISPDHSAIYGLGPISEASYVYRPGGATALNAAPRQSGI